MKNKVILVVEDNEKNLRLVNDILESQGFKVLQARSGKEGVELAQAHKPALIFMDMQMPGIDGLSATRMLKSDQLTSGIPIIAITAMAMEGDREHILQAGCNDYLRKPVSFMDLIETVGKWL